MSRMSITTNHTSRLALRGPRLLGLVALMLLLPVSNMAQQVLDLCGCAGDPTLQPFNAGEPRDLSARDDGVHRRTARPARLLSRLRPTACSSSAASPLTAASTLVSRATPPTRPITLLVAGNVLLRGTCLLLLRWESTAAQDRAARASASLASERFGGNGGFRGGDGSAVAINGAAIGGTGLGPGGGAGGSQTAGAGGGTFFGVPELLPLLGGSGGGGGGGYGAAASCTGGGGGGGGGAILIVANGTLTMQNYDIQAEGGDGGGAGNSTCANGGGGGSGGAIRLVASRFVDNGSGRLWARAGTGHGSSPGTDGRIRLEITRRERADAVSDDPGRACASPDRARS